MEGEQVLRRSKRVPRQPTVNKSPTTITKISVNVPYGLGVKAGKLVLSALDHDNFKSCSWQEALKKENTELGLKVARFKTFVIKARMKVWLVTGRIWDFLTHPITKMMDSYTVQLVSIKPKLKPQPASSVLTSGQESSVCSQSSSDSSQSLFTLVKHATADTLVMVQNANPTPPCSSPSVSRDFVPSETLNQPDGNQLSTPSRSPREANVEGGPSLTPLKDKLIAEIRNWDELQLHQCRDELSTLYNMKRRKWNELTVGNVPTVASLLVQGFNLSPQAHANVDGA